MVVLRLVAAEVTVMVLLVAVVLTVTMGGGVRMNGGRCWQHGRR